MTGVGVVSWRGRPEAGPGSRSASARRDTQKWMRRLHMWSSMTSLLVVLFFSVTGITLNHPTWTFGQPPVISDVKGTMPVTSGGTFDFLRASDYLRANAGVRGQVSDYGAQNGEASISYRAPGYSADVTVVEATGAYTVHSERSGLVAVFNDLHKGRNASPWWKALIDVVAVILTLVALTGIVLQLTIPRTRRSAMVLLGAGAAIGTALVVLAF